MITTAYVQAMAAYNAEMNRRCYAAAARLSDAERRADKRAFWGSIHGSLHHIIWADGAWMARFAGWPPPDRAMRDSPDPDTDFAGLTAQRTAMDAGIVEWAAQLDPAWLEQDLVWFSGATQREMRGPRGVLVAHMFNHQTHHRGQVHCLLSQHGEDTGDTDLPIVLRDLGRLDG